MKKYLAPLLALFVPALALAQNIGQIGSFALQVLDLIDTIVQVLTPITVAAALLVFFFGLIGFIRNGADENKKYMIWGIVALFVMVSVWGLVRFLQNTIGVDSRGLDRVPCVPTPGYPCR
jgi:hypothetical protein